jgi:hypothetical protein
MMKHRGIDRPRGAGLALFPFASIAGLCAAAALFAGCATTRPPMEQLTSTRTAVRAAEGAGCEISTRAAQRLALARNELALAEELLRNGKNREAGFALSRAQADAELALAVAQETVARDAAQKALDQMRALHEHMH